MNKTQSMTIAQINVLTDEQIKSMNTDRATLLANASDAPKPSLWAASKKYVIGAGIFGAGVGVGVGATKYMDSRKATHSAQITQ